MKPKRWSLLAKVVTVLVALASSLQAQDSEQSQHGRRPLRVLRVEQPPQLDGILDEPAWQQAEVASDFLQEDPSEGMPATESTEVRILYDGANLYFGVICFDSDRDGILARELRRDNTLRSDDSFAIILDTFHDHRNAFLFRINPRGTQFDALITEEGRVVNSAWEERWEDETSIHDQGWSAEIKIPLKSIRFAASQAEPVFGIDFERVIRRKNEFTYWNNYSRNFNFNQVSQAGHLVGLEELQAGLRVRVQPYFSTRISNRGGTERSTNLIGDVGLEDVKIPVTSGLTLDLTVNTDFAEAEVDSQIINFDRVPTFFREQREFFLEGAGHFEFRLRNRGRGGRETILYHSRRIGLSKGSTIPILGGGKLSGRLGDRFTLGFLNLQTDSFEEDRPGENFTVFRMKRDLFTRSSVGFLFTNRQSEGGVYNRVVGIDQNLVFYDHLNVTGMLAGSFDDSAGEAAMGGVGAKWADDFWDIGFDYSEIEEDFRAELGFLQRVGIRRYEPALYVSPRPRFLGIRQWRMGIRYPHFRNLEDNSLLRERIHLDSMIDFQDGGGISDLFPRRQTEVLDSDLRLAPGLVVPPGSYQWWYFPIRYFFSPARKVSGAIEYRHQVNYYGKGGRRQGWDMTANLNLSNHVLAEISYSLNRIKRPEGQPVNVHVMNNRLNIAFSRKWMTSTVFQYSNTRDLIGVNFRLRYNYRPGDDLYIVVNSFRRGVGLDREVDRFITIKFTRSFDF